MINETQFNLIQNEEENSKNFTTRLLNNFTALMTLFDNFIFEEEFISLGDEEYFKKRENYNQLLKLKETLEEKTLGDGNKKPADKKVEIYLNMISNQKEHLKSNLKVLISKMVKLIIMICLLK